MQRLAHFLFLPILSIATARCGPTLAPIIAGQLSKIDVSLQKKPPEIQVLAWTQIAKILTLRYPALATKYALRAEQSSGTCEDASAKAQIYELMLDLDFAAAERIGRTIPDKNVLFSAAMRHCQAMRDVRCGLETLHKGLAQGGYHITGITWILDSLNSTDPKAARALFKDVLAHFPNENPTPQDFETLLDAARSIARQDPAAARPAIEKIQPGLSAQALKIVSTK